MDQAATPKPEPYRFKPRRQKEGGHRIGSTNEVPRLLEEAVAPKPGPYRFKPRRQKEGGHRIGSTNEVPRLLEEAITLAAELEGSNGQGSGKLVGFLRKVAREDPKLFTKLLGRVLPLQVENPTTEVREEVRYKTVAEAWQELEERGIGLDVMKRILDPEQVE